MNVDELQRLLSDLAQLLVAAGAKKPADALLEFCVRLQPYRERRLKDLVDLLDQAEEIVRTGTPPPRPRGRTKTPKGDPQVAEAVCNRIIDLYLRAKEPDTTREQIETAFAELDTLELPLPRLQELARRVDISQKLRSKKVLLDAMKRAVLERKGAFQRVQV